MEARAGRSKTTTLGAVNDTLLRAGIPVAGTAWQAKAARTARARELGRLRRGTPHARDGLLETRARVDHASERFEPAFRKG